MQEYTSKESFITEIQKTAELFIQEFDDVAESDLDLRFESVDRTPREIIAYQLGWMELIRSWDKDELSGKQVITPASGYKWNQMGELYRDFYARHSTESLVQLRQMFTAAADFILWMKDFSDDELFKEGGRKWAQSTSSNWPIWKWIHINTVAPFKSFRSKIRKWKKLYVKQ